MSEVSHRAKASAEDVFAVIEDGWIFGAWVVGTCRVRAVDPDWPSAGSRLHVSVGPWPLTADNVTTVLAVEKNVMVDLDAGTWPMGAARVRIVLTPVSEFETDIRLEETFAKGPARLIPGPVESVLLRPRNVESLRRLGAIAAGRSTRA